MKISFTCPECGTECTGRAFRDSYGVEGSPEWDDFEQESGCDCEKSERTITEAMQDEKLNAECYWLWI